LSSITFTIFLSTRYIFFTLPAFEEYLQNATQKSHLWAVATNNQRWGQRRTLLTYPLEHPAARQVPLLHWDAISLNALTVSLCRQSLITKKITLQLLCQDKKHWFCVFKHKAKYFSFVDTSTKWNHLCCWLITEPDPAGF
jgi:hypothetical protein